DREVPVAVRKAPAARTAYTDSAGDSSKLSKSGTKAFHSRDHTKIACETQLASRVLPAGARGVSWRVPRGRHTSGAAYARGRSRSRPPEASRLRDARALYTAGRFFRTYFWRELRQGGSRSAFRGARAWPRR